MKENEVLDDGFSSFVVSHLVSLKGYLKSCFVFHLLVDLSFLVDNLRIFCISY